MSVAGAESGIRTAEAELDSQYGLLKRECVGIYNRHRAVVCFSQWADTTILSAALTFFYSFSPKYCLLSLLSEHTFYLSLLLFFSEFRNLAAFR